MIKSRRRCGQLVKCTMGRKRTRHHSEAADTTSRSPMRAAGLACMLIRHSPWAPVGAGRMAEI